MRVWTSNFDDNKDGKFFNFNIIKINAEVSIKEPLKIRKRIFRNDKSFLQICLCKMDGE